jgi:hypothetical protein
MGSLGQPWGSAGRVLSPKAPRWSAAGSDIGALPDGRPPAEGSVPHSYTKATTASDSRARWPVGGGRVGQAGGCAARRQGEGIGCAPLAWRWCDEGRALSLKAPRWSAARSESRPYRGSAVVGCGRLGDPALPEERRGGVRPARRSEPYREDGSRWAGGSPRRIRGRLGILRGWESGSRGDGVF